jgi:hypothetical protein
LAEVTINTTSETGPNAPAPTPAPTFTPEENPADITKSYNELRAKFTQTSQELSALKKTGAAPASTTEQPSAPASGAPPKIETPPTEGSETNPDGTPKKPDGNNEDAARQVADAAGFDLNPYNDEYATSGDVSEENRTKIADGLKKVLGPDARSIVDQFIEGQKLVHANDRQLFMGEAGGDDNYAAMIEWAKLSLPKEEIVAYNKQIDSGDRHATLFAIRGLRSQYEAVNGRIPNNVRASGGAVSGNVAPFGSAAEMTTAMRDPRYKTDEAFRKQVAARIAVSPNI